MRDIWIVIKKEFKNFSVRKAMVKWYITINLMNIFFVFMPELEIIPITKNRLVFAFIMMFFSAFLVPNTLSLDTIGGEKYHRTLETIISTPISVRTLLYGKTIFILILGALSMFIITIIDNMILLLIFNQSFLNLEFQPKEIIIIYVIALNIIFIIALMGSILSLMFENLKLTGYILSIVNFAILYFVFHNFEDLTYKILLNKEIVLLSLSVFLFFFITYKISKSLIMNYL